MNNIFMFLCEQGLYRFKTNAFFTRSIASVYRQSARSLYGVVQNVGVAIPIPVNAHFAGADYGGRGPGKAIQAWNAPGDLTSVKVP